MPILHPEVGRVRVYEPGHQMQLHPGESAMAELPSVEALVNMMERAELVPLRWHVYPTPTWGGWWKRLRFRCFWWLPIHGRRSSVDFTVDISYKESVH